MIALLAVLGVVGIWSITASLPRRGIASLSERLDPYVAGVSTAPSRLLAAQDFRPITPWPAAERVLRPLVEDAARFLDRHIGGSAALASRLCQAGSQVSIVKFRSEQVIWGAAGFGIGLGIGMLVAAAGKGLVPSALLGGSALTGVGGVMARDWWLSHHITRRRRRILAEFPTLADLLALAVTAGEGPRSAIERVVRHGSGELAGELGEVLAEAKAGAPLTQAVEAMAVRVRLPALERFADGLAVALERGTPLAEVLQAQAADVREAGKRELLEAAGRREVLMLVPVVFLILPVAVLFALYPGFFSLQLLVP